MNRLNIVLPSEVEVVFNGKGQIKLLCETYNAAEIIRDLVLDSNFEASPKERTELMNLAMTIAGRYSGH